MGGVDQEQPRSVCVTFVTPALPPELLPTLPRRSEGEGQFAGLSAHAPNLVAIRPLPSTLMLHRQGPCRAGLQPGTSQSPCGLLEATSCPMSICLCFFLFWAPPALCPMHWSLTPQSQR